MALSPKRVHNISAMAAAPMKITRSGDATIDSFRERMMERSGDGGFNGLRRVLRIMDDDRNGKLSPIEFSEGLQTFGLKYSKADVERLFKMLDKNRDGSISITEFIRGIRPEMSMRRKDLVLKAFKQIDINGDGDATLEEIASLYDASGHPEVIAGRKSEDDIMKEFMQMFGDVDGDAKITQDEFLEYYADVLANIDSEEYAELMLRNAWRLSGGEGNCRNTTCLRVAVHFLDGRTQIVEVKDDIRLNRKDVAAVRAKLESQGVENIKSIDLSGSC